MPYHFGHQTRQGRVPWRYHLPSIFMSTTGWCVVLTPSLGVAPRQCKPPFGRDVEGHDVEGDLVGSPSPSHPLFPLPRVPYLYVPVLVTAIPTVHLSLRSTLPSQQQRTQDGSHRCLRITLNTGNMASTQALPPRRMLQLVSGPTYVSAPTP